MHRGSHTPAADSGILVSSGRPLVVGHRGASHDYPENTLLAFQQAVEAGADAVELDVHLTSDGIPVVIHDDTLDRTTSGSGLVANCTLRELKGLDAGRAEQIPSLAEVLDGFPELPLIIEIKHWSAGGAVVEVILDLGARSRVLVGSFQHAALRPFRRASLPTTASRPEAVVWWSLSRVGLRAPRLPYQAFSVPERSGLIHVVDHRFVQCARRRGIPVHVWTVNEPEDALRLWSAGVTGVITNRPGVMVVTLEQARRSGGTF